MAEIVPDHSHSHALVEHPERHHRIADVPIRPLLIILIGFVIAALIWHVALGGLFWAFEQHQQQADTPMTAVKSRPIATPEPRVQSIPTFHPNTPRMDVDDMRKRNEEVLTTYGKTNDPKFVRIPIDRAMNLMVERNMLSTQTPATQKGPADANH